VFVVLQCNATAAIYGANKWTIFLMLHYTILINKRLVQISISWVPTFQTRLVCFNLVEALYETMPKRSYFACQNQSQHASTFIGRDVRFFGLGHLCNHNPITKPELSNHHIKSLGSYLLVLYQGSTGEIQSHIFSCEAHDLRNLCFLNSFASDVRIVALLSGIMTVINHHGKISSWLYAVNPNPPTNLQWTPISFPYPETLINT